MDQNGRPDAPIARSRVWRIDGVEFDEGRWSLSVNGQRPAVETKPMLLFHALLCAGGEVVTKDELLQTVWPDVHVSEGSLTTAVSKLRSALGRGGRAIVEGVHGIGYRIGRPVELSTAADRAGPTLDLQAGAAVPNRPQWRLERELGSDVWLVRHEKTGELRVFKFADSAQRLGEIKREAMLSRVLHDALGERPDFVRILEWNFERRPFFVESAYGGLDLVAWAAERGGIENVSLAERVAIVARAARSVAAAHEVGVLHRDIKPSNILCAGSADGETVVRLVDFGAGQMTEAARQHAAAMTGMSVTVSLAAGQRGTLRYLAPEVLDGGPATMSSDVYALGVVLYQMVVGDLSRSLGNGWEADIDDPLLRADVAAAVDRELGRRLGSAAALADRLERLEERREERRRAEAKAREQAALAIRVERMRVRRPWVVLAVASLVLGLVGFGVADADAIRKGRLARREAQVALAVDQFMTRDLLARGDPANSGKPDETLMDAATKAEADVDRRFAKETLIAATIHAALAEVFEDRSAFAAARHAYDRAVADFIEAKGPGSAEATMLRLRRVGMEVMSFEPGAIERAGALITDAEAHFGSLGSRSAEGQAWLAYDKGALELLGGDVGKARALFRTAADEADAMPQAFDELQRFVFRQREAYASMRVGDWTTAEAIVDRLIPREMATLGAGHPETLLTEETAAQLLMVRGEPAKAVDLVNRIYPVVVSVLGPTSHLALVMLGTRAGSLGTMERYDESIRDDQTMYDAAVAKQGRQAFMALGALTDIGISQCRGGHVEAGLGTARRAYETGLQAYGPKNVFVEAMQANVAFCLLLEKQDDDASRLIAGIDAKAVGELIADPHFAAELDLMRAAIALQERDVVRAKALLSGPERAFGDRLADPYFKHWTATLERLVSG